MKLLYTTAQGDLVKLKVANGTYMQIPRLCILKAFCTLFCLNIQECTVFECYFSINPVRSPPALSKGHFK